jgi:hypothetical protein
MKVQVRAFSKESVYLGTISIAEDLSTEERLVKVVDEFKDAADYWCLDDKVKEYLTGKIELLTEEEGKEMLALPEGEKSFEFTKQSRQDEKPVVTKIYESELTQFHIDLLVGDLIKSTWNRLPDKAQKSFLHLVNSQMAINGVILEQKDIIHVDYPGKEEMPVILLLSKTEEGWLVLGSNFTIEEECIKELEITFDSQKEKEARLELNYTAFAELIKKVKEWKSTKNSK